jgi:predicted O-methyltransferase YrrM
VEVVERAQDALGAGARPEYTLGRHDPWQPLNPVIQALENDKRSFPASVFPPVSRFLYALIRCLRPKLALETGCYIGYSSLCIAQAMEENSTGHLHSFDLFLKRPGLQSPVAGACADSLKVARTHAEKAELSHRITFHPGDSAVRIRDLFGDRGEVFDFAFVDGDHTIEGALADWYEVDRILAPGGMVMLHDTMPQKCGWVGPRRLLDMLHEKTQGRYQAINLPTPEGYGIALIQKESPGTGPEMPPSLWELLRERLFREKLNTAEASAPGDNKPQSL